MKSANLVSETLRHSESGLCWEEKITNNTGSVEVPRRGTVRVRATGASTVTIGGVLAATMSSGEVMIFNVGKGDPDETKKTVTVTIGTAAAYVQVARELDRKSITSTTTQP